jgi:hypothetical protein
MLGIEFKYRIGKKNSSLKDIDQKESLGLEFEEEYVLSLNE